MGSGGGASEIQLRRAPTFTFNNPAPEISSFEGAKRRTKRLSSSVRLDSEQCERSEGPTADVFWRDEDIQ